MIWHIVIGLSIFPRHTLLLIFDVCKYTDTVKIWEEQYNSSLTQLYFLLTWYVVLCTIVDWSFMIYHNIFLEFLLREIGNKFVNNCRKSCKVGVESSDIVAPEATFPVVYSFICLAVVWEG